MEDRDLVAHQPVALTTHSSCHLILEMSIPFGGIIGLGQPVLTARVGDSCVPRADLHNRTYFETRK